jgi:hypothetical protein
MLLKHFRYKMNPELTHRELVFVEVSDRRWRSILECYPITIEETYTRLYPHELVPPMIRERSPWEENEDWRAYQATMTARERLL